MKKTCPRGTVPKDTGEDQCAHVTTSAPSWTVRSLRARAVARVIVTGMTSQPALLVQERSLTTVLGRCDRPLLAPERPPAALGLGTPRIHLLTTSLLIRWLARSPLHDDFVIGLPLSSQGHQCKDCPGPLATAMKCFCAPPARCAGPHVDVQGLPVASSALCQAGSSGDFRAGFEALSLHRAP